METPEPVIKEILLDAPISKVWKHITDKELISKWFMTTDDFVPTVGNEFNLMDTSHGEPFASTGKVVEVEHEKKLSFTWTSEEDPGEDLVTIELFESEGKTILKLTHSGLLYLTVQDKITRENVQQGWDMMIDKNLKPLVEMIS